MKVHLRMGSDVLEKAIKQVLGLFFDESVLEYVNSVEEAVVVIVPDWFGLKRYHTPDKFFVIVSILNPGELPGNARWVHPAHGLVSLVNLLVEFKENSNKEVI